MDFTPALKFLVYSLAIWRLTYLIARDNGPFHIFDWFRFKIGVRQYYVNGHMEVDYSNPVAEMVHCMYCLSFWITLVAIPGWFVTNLQVAFLYDMAATFLALWGVATLFAMVLNSMGKED